MKKLILGVLILVALASCDSQGTVWEEDKITGISSDYTNFDGKRVYRVTTEHSQVYTLSSNHKVGDIVTIIPATDPSQFKLPLRDAESRQCLNCDTVVITHYVDYREGSATLSDTTIHYFKSKYP